MQIYHEGYWRKKCKIGSKGVRKGSLDLLLKFGDPLNMSGTSNLASRWFTIGTNERKAKLSHRVWEKYQVTYFWNFGTPSISRERFVIITLIACFRGPKNWLCLWLTGWPLQQLESTELCWDFVAMIEKKTRNCTKNDSYPNRMWIYSYVSSSHLRNQSAMSP